MCGICGVLSLAGEPAPPEVLAQMTHRLRHRGPDDHGVYLDGPLGLGFRRLSILDLSAAGHQPMGTEDGRLWIVFNGEIYNFPALRRQLESQGHRFRSNTDTEVLLQLFQQYGADCLPMLNGMFAFAVWDRERQELFVARDRFGIKPLCYYFDGDRFAFSSEIKSLLCHPDIPRQLDFAALDFYLSWNYIPAPWSIFRDIRKLKPGHCLRVNDAGLREERWYSLLDNLSQGPLDLSAGEAGEELRALISDSVRMRLISDVPLGAFLSGGLDSSIVVAMMADHAGAGVKTFTIGYQDAAVFDESGDARLVARVNHTQHHEHLLTPGAIIETIPRVLDHLDEPFGDSSAVSTYLVSQNARQDVTVALSGDGGDEVFGGYSKYLGEYFQRYYRLAPRVIRQYLIEPALQRLGDSRDSALRELLRQIKKFVHGSQGEEQSRRHYLWMNIYSDEMKAALWERGPGEEHPYGFIADLYEPARGVLDPINQMLYTDVHCCLPYDMLMKVDGMSMAHSLEVRLPLLDYRVVELAFRIRGSEKLKGWERKRVLRETFKTRLPPEILHKRKQGFDLPMGEWIKGDLRPLFLEVVNRETARSAGLNFKTITELFQAHLEGRQDHSFRLWNVFSLLWWLQRGPLAGAQGKFLYRTS